MYRVRHLPLASLALVFFCSLPAASQELLPGRLYDPCTGSCTASFQMVTDLEYVEDVDEYFIAYSGEHPGVFGYASLGRMDPEGNWLGHTSVSPAPNVHAVDIAYNSNVPGFFYTYRYEGVNSVFGVYLDANGVVVPGSEVFLGIGNFPKVEFSPQTGNYLVAWETLAYTTEYRLYDGDPSVSTPLLWADGELGLSYAGDLAYGSGKFMMIFIKDSGATKSDIWGRFVDPNGGLGTLFPVDASAKDQQWPKLGYDAGAGRFVGLYGSWNGSPVRALAKLIDPASGAVTDTEVVANQANVYEIPQSFVYNPTSGTSFIVYYHGAPALAHLRIQEYAVTGNSMTKVDPYVLLSDQFGSAQASAARPETTDPQVTFIYSDSVGANGIHAGILDITPPPPDETAPAAAVLGGLEGPGSDQVTVTWTAPGDDDNTGQADSYDLRYSLTSPFVFATATPMAIPSPQSAGAAEQAIISGLPAETLVYVGLMTSDEVPNVSPLSNVAMLNTPGVAPAPVSDLLAFNPGGTSAQLSWTATGDDGVTGTATSYDLRFATFPITDGNFAAATPVLNPPNPSPSGTPENFVATGLPPETMIYFGIKVVDDANIASPSDTGADPSVTTLDLSPPEQTTDLSADSSGGPMNLLPATAIASSGSVSYLPATNATDAIPGSFWSTPARASMVDEFITVDTSLVGANIGRVRLLSRGDYGGVFPEDLEIQVSPDNVSFTTVHTETGLPTDAGLWHEFTFPPVPGQYVRVYITKTHDIGSYYAQIAEFEVYESPIVLGSANLTWTAPGDNADQGTAAEYDLRWSTSNITTGNFGSATQLDPSEIPVPQVAGSTETTTVTNLPPESLVYFAFKSRDEIPNLSPLSNVVSAQTAGVAPHAIDDFIASSPTGTTVDLSWSAVGDDGDVGTAAAHDVRVSTSPINAGNFDAASMITVPAPGPPGTLHNHTVTGLPPSTPHYFAIKTRDELNNWSPIHTNGTVMHTTLDTAPPEMITDLTASVGSSQPTVIAADAIESSGQYPGFVTANATDGNPGTFWSSPGGAPTDPEFITVFTGNQDVNIGQVRLLSRNPGILFPEDLEIQISSDNVNYTTVHSEIGLPADSSTWHDLDFPGFMGRYVRIYITKMRSSGSSYAQIAEIEVSTVPVSSGAATLMWTAPGDDADVGMASSYDIRWSTSPINGGNFGSANMASAGEIPVPQLAGTPETATISGLPTETLVYFAVKSSDENPNVSPISNIANTSTMGQAPNAIDDLQASNPTGSSIRLDWTAVGDDGDTGTASAYDLRVSTSPITAANFDSQTNIAIPAPAPSGTPESFNVTGLPSDVTHYFAIKARDELNNWSLIQSNGTVMAATLDIIPPSAIVDLSANSGVTLLTAPAIAASSSFSAFPFSNATDGNLASFWSSKGTPTDVDEYITVDTQSDHSVGRVRLLSRDPGFVFPEDLEVQVSSDNVNFTTVHSATGLPTTNAFWHEFNFAPRIARYVRIYVTKMRSSGAFYAQIAEIEVYDVPSGDSLAFEWTAPGDDGPAGTALTYDLRYSTSSILSESAFNSATPVVGEPAPLAAGLENTMTLSAPQEGITLHFAIKAIDDSGNPGPVSNDLEVTTVVVPPGQITDLAVSSMTSTSAFLSWTATGDSGVQGTAMAYEVRYSTSQLTEGNFSAATLAAGIPTPSPPGTPESMTVTGLSPNSTYYFGVRVHDETATPSLLSNVPSGLTEAPDVIAPSPVFNLAGGPPFDSNIVAGSAIASSGSFFPHQNATDGNVNSLWSSPGRGSATDEFVTVDTFGQRDFTKVRLLSRNPGILFPEDLEIQVSDDNVNYSTVATGVGLSDANAEWHEFDFPPATGRYVRVYITKSRLYGGLYYAQIAEIEVFEGGLIPGPILLTWNAPGDDADVGMAAAYDLRWSHSTITAGNFGSATQISIPSPANAGVFESASLGTLPPESDVYLALKTMDEVPNIALLSNVIFVSTPGEAPAAVNDLSVTGTTGTTADLTWTATGDDGNVGTATSYELRWSLSPIDASNFPSANLVAGLSAPGAAGASESHTVMGLPNASMVYFGLNVIDDKNLESGLNTNLPVTAQTPDTIDPEMVDDLTLASISSVQTLVGATAVSSSGDYFDKLNATDGILTSFWTTPPRSTQQDEFITVDLATSRDIGRVRLLSRMDFGLVFPEDIQIQVSDNNVNFTTVHTAVGLANGNGVWHTFDIAATGRYVRIYVTKTRVLGTTYYAQIGEIEVYEAGVKDSLLVTFTAPGDDADQGTATAYQLKYSTSSINAGNFAAATDIPTGAPQVAGATESFVVDGLASGTYYVAVIAEDDAGNFSVLSNVPSETIP